MIPIPLALPSRMPASPVAAVFAMPVPARSHRPRRVRRATWRARFHLLGALLLCDTAQALPHDALPAGAQVREGGVEIACDTRGMQIRQSSEHAIIDWRSFDIGRDASLRIFQHANAALLNRVLGTTTSTIAGELSATSTVHLVNPNGIHISPTGTVSAAGFVAATLDVTNADFLDRALRFGSAGRPDAGTVRLDGSIAIEPGGFAALLGHRVEQRGLIRTPLGKTGLGAGQAITLTPAEDMLLAVVLAGERAPADVFELTARDRAAIVMSGTIDADGGLVQIAAPMQRASARAEAVNVSGAARARHAFARTGAVLVHAEGGTARVTGRLDASSNDARAARGTGGIVEVRGLRVLMENGSIDVSGELGGGHAWVLAHRLDARGGAATPVPTDAGDADPLVFVGAGARIDASATYQGDDGNARCVSDGRMVFLAHGETYDAPAGLLPNQLKVIGQTVVPDPVLHGTPRGAAAHRPPPSLPSLPSLPRAAPPALPHAAVNGAHRANGRNGVDAAHAAVAAALPVPVVPPQVDAPQPSRASPTPPRGSLPASNGPSSPASSARSSSAASGPAPGGWHRSPGGLAQRAGWDASPMASGAQHDNGHWSPAASEPLPRGGQPSSPAFSERPLSSWQPSPNASELPSLRWTPSPAGVAPRQGLARARTALDRRSDEPASPPPPMRRWSGDGMPPPLEESASRPSPLTRRWSGNGMPPPGHGT